MRRMAMMVGVLVLLTRAAWAPGPCAMVTDLSGAVRLDGEPASILTLLHPGCVLDVAAGGGAVVTYFKNGARYRITGPARVQIDPDGARALQGTGLQSLPPEAALAPFPLDVARFNTERGFGGKSDMLALTTDDVVVSRKPIITWRSRSPFQKYVLTVVDQNDRIAFQAVLPARSRETVLPAGKALRYGGRYELRLDGVRGDRRVRALSRELDVLPAERVAELHRLAARAEQAFHSSHQDVTPLVALMSVYASNGLYRPALRVAERIIALRPDDRRLYLLAGKLYEACQDFEKADAMYRKAGVVDPDPG